MAEPCDMRNYGYRSGYLVSEVKSCLEALLIAEQRLSGKRNSDARATISRKIADARRTLALVEDADRRIAAELDATNRQLGAVA